MKEMERVNKILQHSQYRHNLDKIEMMEMERVYCHHNLQHFIDVARVGYIIALERNFKLAKEIIYAAALLHDIARWEQYESGADHAVSSAKFAYKILEDCCFTKDEIKMILEAIKKHRTGQNLTSELDYVLYEGDKQSRLCVDCHSIKNCKRFTGGIGPTINY